MKSVLAAHLTALKKHISHKPFGTALLSIALQQSEDRQENRGKKKNYWAHVLLGTPCYVVILCGSQALNKYFHNKAMAHERLHLAWHVNCHIYQAKLLLTLDGPLGGCFSLNVAVGSSTKPSIIWPLSYFSSGHNNNNKILTLKELLYIPLTFQWETERKKSSWT